MTCPKCGQACRHYSGSIYGRGCERCYEPTPELSAAIEAKRNDSEFMTRLRRIHEQEKPLFDRLKEGGD